MLKSIRCRIEIRGDLFTRVKDHTTLGSFYAVVMCSDLILGKNIISFCAAVCYPLMVGFCD